jgi:NADPH:quinone reductase-like Zn-dependent oxidoreductase/acyl carrier protein
VAAHGKPVISMRHPQEKTPDLGVLLGALGRIWTEGADVDWEAYFAAERRRRIPLPKYAFERQRYWVMPLAGAPVVAPAGAAQWTRHADVADWFYAPAWSEAPVGPPAAASGRWLLLADPGPSRNAIEARLRDAGQDLVIAECGPAFEQFGIGQYRINPGAKEDVAALWDALRADGKVPNRIVHALALSAPAGEALDAYERTQDRCFFSLLFLAQALGRETLTEPVHLAALTRGLQSVAGEAVVAPERATLIGPCRVIAQEFPTVFSVAIDVDGSDDEAAAAVIAELTAAPRDPVVAWRGGRRRVQRFEARGIQSGGQPPIKAGGTYLVTGGLGGLGLKVAEWLARTAQARLVLVNRSPLPPPADRDGWLAGHSEDDRTSRRIRAVRGLEQLGAEVLVVSADSAALEPMRAAVAEARARFGRIDGILHAAGVAGDGVIQLKDKPVAAAVLDAKVKGALVLAAVLRDDPPDFVVHFSSLAAVVGGFGQVDYCGANASLDAMAATIGGPRTISINWDAWAEVGMAVETAARPKLAQLFKQAAAFQAIEHPIYNRVRMDGEEIHYVAELDAERSWLVADHVLFGKPTLPGTAYLELVRSALARHADASSCELTDVFILALFSVEPGRPRDIHVVLTRDEPGYDFVIKSPAPHDPENWVEHCRGHIRAGTTGPARRHDFDALTARCTSAYIEAHASAHAAPGLVVRQAAHLSVGPRWLTPEWVRMGEDEGVAEQRLADAYVGDLKDYLLHPGLLDLTAFYPFKVKLAGIYIPFSHRVVRMYQPMPARVRNHARVTHDPKSGDMHFDALFLDHEGNEVVVMEDYSLKRIETRGEAKPDQGAGGVPIQLFPFLPGAENFQVDMSALGQLDTLVPVASERRAPGPGQLEIQICAAGLNFKDVLRALGMLSAEHDAGLALGFGGECAGQVVRIGEGVTGFHPGDRVIAMGPKCFGGFLTVDAIAAVPLAEGLSYTEAATIPTVFFTAHYALEYLGRLRKGEKVLIHAAAGGVGLAAVQCAQRVGAEVFATAGSPRKRDYLKSIGVQHVFDSRSIGFADEVMKATGGQGVDVVLNSLAGEFIHKNFAVLAPMGRFLEIGARDIYQNTQIGLRPFAKNLSFIALEISPVLLTRPQFARDVLGEIMGYFRSGAFKALPTEVFPITQVADAFRHMAAAQHIGKIVLSITPPARPLPIGIRSRAPSAAVKEAAGAAAKGGAHEAALTPAEGVEALARILGAAHPQVAVSSRPLQPIIEFMRKRTEAEVAAVAAAPGSRKLYPRPALANAYIVPATATQKSLAQIWQDLIGIEQVGVQDNFFELGGDSLIGVQVLSRIKREFGVQLAPASLYEGPTLEGFARAIEQARAGTAEPPAVVAAGEGK